MPAGSCKLDMMLYVPQGAPAPHRPPMHPLNALRNRAVAAAQTKVLLLLDADFMVSSSLNELQHSTWVQTAVSQGVLVVLPALEPVRSDAAAQQAVARACRGGKAEALAGLGQGSLQPFHVDRFEPGHSATNFARWSTSNETYDVSYSMGFEPYVLVSKRLVPWYDERFTGYLEDKVVHIQTMVHMGFTFAVHPSAFVVHYPHPDSHDQALVKTTGLMQEAGKSVVWIKGMSELQIQGQGDHARAEMAAGTYWPPTRFAPCNVPYKTAASTGFVQGCRHEGAEQVSTLCKIAERIKIRTGS
ncbi:hypothetical protein ABBQ32_006997 [Trebouxia sp. C0010 RCD-2024]